MRPSTALSYQENFEVPPVRVVADGIKTVHLSINGEDFTVDYLDYDDSVSSDTFRMTIQ